MGKRRVFNVVLLFAVACIWIYIMYRVCSIYSGQDAERHHAPAGMVQHNPDIDYRLTLSYRMPFDVGEDVPDRKDGPAIRGASETEPVQSGRYVGRICADGEELLVLQIDGEYVYAADDAGVGGHTCTVVSSATDTLTVRYGDNIFRICM